MANSKVISYAELLMQRRELQMLEKTAALLEPMHTTIRKLREDLDNLEKRSGVTPETSAQPHEENTA